MILPQNARRKTRSDAPYLAHQLQPKMITVTLTMRGEWINPDPSLDSSPLK